MGGINSDTEYEKLVSGSISGLAQSVNLTTPNMGTVSVQITGTWSGTLILEASNDGFVTSATIDALAVSTSLFVSSISSNGMYLSSFNGYSEVRIKSSAWTSGTVDIASYGSDDSSVNSGKSTLVGATNGTKIGNTGDRLKSADGLRQGGVFGAVTLTTANTAYEAKVGGAKLANRRSLTVTAMDDMYWGYDNTVTTSNGTPLFKNQQIVFSIDSDSTFEIWLVASANSKTARVTESL